MVALLGGLGRMDRHVVLRQVGIPLIRLTAEKAVEALEATAERPAMERTGSSVLLSRREMPLPDAERVVAVAQQHLGKHAVFERHPAVVPWVAGRQFHDAGDSTGVVVAAG